MTDFRFVTDELKKNINAQNILENEPMKNHTSFKIGGDAKIFVMPQSEDEILWVLKTARSTGTPVFTIGNGSNLLVGDLGFNGIIMHIGKNFSNVSTDGNFITAQAGATLAKIAAAALGANLTGFEFASGIPGSLGGAVVMNAGAYGGEMKDVVVSTKYIDENLNICTVCADEHKFAYRKSRFGENDVILESKIKLLSGNYIDIKNKMNELNARRKEKQPLDKPSAGSTFKRPEGYFAAKLIDDAGLSGFKSGGAMVSDKHCGFVVNYNNASFDDVINVINIVKKEVYNKFGVKLECEVKILN